MGRIVECMAKPKPKSQPTWTDVKEKLADFDRTALLGLIQSLYSAHKDNQTFLHARFGLGEDVLEPYKKTIDRWLGILRRGADAGGPRPFRWLAATHV